MKYIIEIETDNESFMVNPRELRDCLNKVATKINAFGDQVDGRKILDSHGNTVGTIKVVKTFTCADFKPKGDQK